MNQADLHPELFAEDQKNIDRRTCKRVVPMEVLNLSMPRSGTMCKSAFSLSPFTTNKILSNEIRPRNPRLPRSLPLLQHILQHARPRHVDFPPACQIPRASPLGLLVAISIRHAARALHGFVRFSQRILR